MKTIAEKMAVVLVCVAVIVGAESFLSPLCQQSGVAWKAPKSADTIKNPFRDNTYMASATGKKLFEQYCATCHGATGKGDGAVGASLIPRPASLTDAPVVKETDGSLFWKITTGKSPMPSWSVSIKPEQRWDIICYIRLLQERYSTVKPMSSADANSTKGKGSK